MKRIYESMTRLDLGSNRFLRVWCTTSTDKELYGPDPQVVAAINALGQFPSVLSVREALDKLEHVSAYEITGSEGNGFVIYREWP